MNRRLSAILLLGFASGLPLALSGSTLQAWFAAANISIITIGMLSLVGQPYVYKFLWAPFLDRFAPSFLDRRRGWIVIAQIGLVFSLAAMAFFQPQQHALTLATLALIIAFFSATQDIAIDAYRTDLLAPQERGLGAAFTMTGYRIAMIVSGGLALIIADHHGWKFTYLLMATVMAIAIFCSYLSPRPDTPVVRLTLRQTLIEPWQQFIKQPYALTCALFLVFYKLGDAFTISLSSAFLLKYLHFSLTAVGTINKIVGIAASVFGGITGGLLLARISLFRALWWFGIAQAFASFFYLALAIAGKNYPLLIATVTAENFFGGMSAAALITFITGLCDKRFSAGQFALFSAIDSIGRVFIGPVAGLTAASLGWVYFFSIAFLLSLPGLWLLWHLRNRYDAHLFAPPTSNNYFSAFRLQEGD